MSRPDLALEIWEVTGPWRAISVTVCPVDDLGRTRTEDEKRRIAVAFAIQDSRIGDGAIDARRIA